MKFICGGCSSRIVFRGLGTACLACGWKPLTVSGKPSWIAKNQGVSDHSDPLDRLKAIVKRYPRTYTALTALISPVYPFAGGKELKSLLKQNSSGVMVNVGSGADRIHDKILNLDIQPFAQVDAVVDASNIPIESGSVDLVVSIAVLEHVLEPNKVATEIARILKPGGIAYVSAPFIAGFHSSPHDYQRYTLPGLLHLFENLAVEKAVSIGPTSAMIWVASEWLALVFSLGNFRIQMFLAVIIGALLSPLKYLDAVLGHWQGSHSISVGFSVILRKTQNP